MKTNLKNISLKDSATLKDAMRVLNESPVKLVLVLGNKDQLLGTVTDGDVRRGLLTGLSLDDPIRQIMNRDPTVAMPEMGIEIIRGLIHSNRVCAIPIVDAERKIVGLETIDSLEPTHNMDVDVILMAGGFGKRLLPLTQDIPKPMLPLEGNKPMLEGIIEEFVRQGFHNFYISTHYKSDAIKDYFKDGKEFGCTINYTQEAEPLGTAGALSLLKEEIKNSFIVMNADLSVKINYRNLIEFHHNHQALATMCVRRAEYQVPYGVVELEDLHIKGIQEKPHYAYLINAGIYCFSREILDYITFNQQLDMPTLFQKIIKEQQNVSAFPIHEYWVDIGNVEGLDQARKEYQSA